ncbi:MAG: hypothetical protein V4690_01635 [Patescibacteria group bacterium]
MKEPLVVLDKTGSAWQEIMSEMLAKSAHIIAFRGAGSYNGISIADAKRIVEQELIPRIDMYTLDGPVSIIFDGDDDDPEYPDIGHIVGRLRDHYEHRVDFYAVQMLSWYRYAGELPAMRPLHSAGGNEYKTVLFPDKIFAGEHDHFSQNALLTRSSKYEQWYIGACGAIATQQLFEYSLSVEGSQGLHKVLLFKAPVSIEQERKILRRIEESKDAERTERLLLTLVRRQENPYGLLYNPNGDFIWRPDFSNLSFKII